MPRKPLTAAPHSWFSKRLTAQIDSVGHPPTPEFVFEALKRQNPRLRVTLPTVHNWLTGRTIPTWQNLDALATWLKMPPGALLNRGPCQPARATTTAGLTLDGETQRLVETFLSLNTDQRKITLLVVQALAAKQQAEFISILGSARLDQGSSISPG
jgi:transcriptional regulator with XRE-family HTH domain